MFKRPIEKFIPLDQDEQKHRLELERSYRDRAEERRRGETEFQEYGDKVVIEDSAIQLRGLDLDLLKQQQIEIEKKEKELSKLRGIMQTGLLKEVTKVKEVTQHKIGPLALKIQSYLNQKDQVNPIKNQRTYYVYDMHPCFALKQPDIVTKKFEEVDAQQQQIFPILKEDVYDFFLRVYESTQQLTLARTSRAIIANPVHQSDSDDIFEDVKTKISKPVEEEEEVAQDMSESSEKDKEEFDPREYVKQLEAEEDMLNEEYNEKYKEKLEIEEKQRLEKLKRQQKMLQEEEDYYVECFQPTNNVQVDPDEAIVDKKGVKKGQGKFAKGKPKKKRENFDKQFEQIEEILKKKRG